MPLSHSLSSLPRPLWFSFRSLQHPTVVVAGYTVFVPLLFVNSLNQALLSAVPVGLLGGLAIAAYLDLIVRSCPRGLEGTMIMMSGGLYFVSTRIGDVVGTFLYDQVGGFAACVLLMTTTYISIPFVLFL
jgi:hypothetical protein